MSSKVKEISDTCLYRENRIDRKEVKEMRKAFLVGLILTMLMGLASLALASELTLGNEIQVWRWDEEEEEFVPEPIGGLNANARAWHQGDALSGYCNKETWTIPVATHTSVAQWIRWQISAQGWRMFVRKPGTYTADCINASIKSNADVLVTFEGFDDLKNDLGEAIETFYAFGEESPFNITDWYPAKTLDQQQLQVPYCEHSAHLWIKIVVREDASGEYPKTRACEYQDDASFKISVTVYKPWLDPDGSGNFAE